MEDRKTPWPVSVLDVLGIAALGGAGLCLAGYFRGWGGLPAGWCLRGFSACFALALAAFIGARLLQLLDAYRPWGKLPRRSGRGSQGGRSLPYSQGVGKGDASFLTRPK